MNPMLLIYLATVLAGAAVLTVILGGNMVIGNRVDVNSRLGGYVGSVMPIRASKPTSRARQRQASSFSESIARQLAQADLKLTVSEYLFIHLACALVGFVVGFMIGHQVASGIPLALLGLFLPRIYVGRRQSGRTKAFNDQLADSLMLMANSLRSGYSLLQSFEVVSREAPHPTNEEYTRIVREVGLGLSPQEALENLVRRINSDDLDLIVTAIAIQHESGGNLARILDGISATIRDRVKLRGEISVLTSQQRITGYVIGGLPVGIGGILYVMNPEYISVLFTFKKAICMPAIGLPIIAGVLMGLGFLVIRKIVNIEV